ncbi:transcription factor iiib 90 kda subunit [Trichoderma arundinaceum]|uniref:Transcription factor iiib 90 kDa subunit n=1 Tax=Trichoderma arundinaceum TaxID=490622 RepID=A0A395N7U3_TRIAR|nr:transcription factor iiib 90 kda subunit [Trichoderma arundinaceum]
MSQYQAFPDRNTFASLKDKVVVVAGGASGIGAALVTILHRYGAHVVFGDINHDSGGTLIQSLFTRGRRANNGSALTFLPCDVCKYNDIYSLFHTARGKHNRVDHAVFVLASVGKDQGSTRTIEVNFLAACAFARISIPFLRRQATDKGQADVGQQLSNNSAEPSLTFLSSVTGFRDAPGMFLYQTSKQAILGLMRAMRTVIFSRDGIRVNAICPGMTESPITSTGGLICAFKGRSPESSAQLPSHYQSSAAVAGHIASVMLAKGLNGKSIYVEEGKGWDFEDGLAREMPRWLGEEPTRWSDENLTFLESLGSL